MFLMKGITKISVIILLSAVLAGAFMFTGMAPSAYADGGSEVSDIRVNLYNEDGTVLVNLGEHPYIFRMSFENLSEQNAPDGFYLSGYRYKDSDRTFAIADLDTATEDLDLCPVYLPKPYTEPSGGETGEEGGSSGEEGGENTDGEGGNTDGNIDPNVTNSNGNSDPSGTNPNNTNSNGTNNTGNSQTNTSGASPTGTNSSGSNPAGVNTDDGTYSFDEGSHDLAEEYLFTDTKDPDDTGWWIAFSVVMLVGAVVTVNVLRKKRRAGTAN